MAGLRGCHLIQYSRNELVRIIKNLIEAVQSKSLPGLALLSEKVSNNAWVERSWQLLAVAPSHAVFDLFDGVFATDEGLTFQDQRFFNDLASSTFVSHHVRKGE